MGNLTLKSSSVIDNDDLKRMLTEIVRQELGNAPKISNRNNQLGNVFQTELCSQENQSERKLISSVSEYEQFIKNSLSNSYWTSVKNANEHLSCFLGDICLAEINQRTAEKVLSYIQEKVRKGYRVYFRNIKAMFNKFVDWDYIAKNPFIKVKLPKNQQTAPLFLSIEELNLILKHILHKGTLQITIFAFFTGCRLAEIINLTWDDINFNERTIRIGSSTFTTKTRKQRILPMCDEVFELLQSIYNENNVLDQGGFVFAKEDCCKHSQDYVSKSFKKACIKANMNPGVHFHTLRHSFASNLAQDGVSLYVVKELLGHGSITTTEIYSHLNINSLRNAIKVFDSKVPDLGESNKERKSSIANNIYSIALAENINRRTVNG